VSLLLLFLAAVLCFFVLLTVSERFFCPALELISEYLRLPPVVAGATLLSFGNGAPDIFTQVAAVGQVRWPGEASIWLHGQCPTATSTAAVLRS
jgi:Ca2+/Na+ antiporter